MPIARSDGASKLFQVRQPGIVIAFVEVRDLPASSISKTLESPPVPAD